MANNLDSNITRKLARVFLDAFESARVLTRTVNTQLLDGQFNPSTGEIVDFKRPHDYRSVRTSGGDITGNKSDIIAGKASGTVQDFFTVAMDYTILEQALRLDQLDQVLAPAATRIVTDMEVDLGAFMIKNAGLVYGTPGTAVTTWGHVAGAGSTMHATGVPTDGQWYYAMNPFVAQALADTQGGLASGDNDLVNAAWRRAQVSRPFAGLQALASNALSTRTSSDAADRAGTLTANPDATYLTAKDTMTQTLAVTGFSANATVNAGDIITIEGRNRLNLSTRQPYVDGSGSQVIWSATVTADVTLGASGEGNLVVTGPALNEANGQYNTVDSAPQSGDVINILGTASAIYQPNLFYHEQAFGIGTVKLPKLYSTDTVATTEDGFSIRVSKYSDGDANKQSVRFDLLPAYATFNPFFAGQGFGTS